MKIKRKGVALVVVIVLILLFSAIILSVVLTSTSAYRRSTYFRDRSIALNLAHIGIADALYKLNYRYHDPLHYYGFATDGECFDETYVNTHGYPKNNQTYSYTLNARDLGILHGSVNDGVTVKLIINDGTGNDSIVATGRYRGRTVTLETGIRTLSDENTNLWRPLADNTWWDTKGIPEAFNKHVIYANTVSGNASNAKGNITATNASSLTGGTDTTLTDSSVNPPVPLYPNIEQPENLSGYTLPPFFPSDDWVLFRPLGASGTQARMSTDGGQKWDNLLPSGVTYDGGVFTFTNYETTKKIYVMQSSVNQQYGNVIINGAKIRNEFYADGYIRFQGTCNIQPAPGCKTFFKAGVRSDHVGTQDITVDANTVFDGGDLILFRGALTGSSISIGNNVRINNGALVSDYGFSIPSDLTIYAQNSTRQAAILIYSKNNSITLNINNTPSITLGPNQRAAFMVLTEGSGNNVTVNIGTTTNLDFEINPIQNMNNKAAIIACAWNGTANVNLGSSTNYVRLRGLIYARGTNPASDGITLNNANTRIYGCFVTNGFVNLGNSGVTLIYDSSLYKEGFLNNQVVGTADIYPGFVGGRRIYLPFNWKLVW